MILLNGHSLEQDRKVPLEKLSTTLKERDSKATMIPADMTGITYNSWFLDETEPGAGTVWRVKSISEAYNTNTPTVQLEHAICLLKDRLMFGEVTAGDMAGNSSATSCTAEQAIRYILSYQEDWVLGECQYNVSNPYKFNGDTLFDALETVTKSLADAWWEYDTTVYPFRLYIIRKTNDYFSEMRAGRNIRTISKTVDKSGMFTRFYPIGKDDLHIDGDYIEMNSYQFGIIAKVDTDTSIDDKAELRRWAIEQLEIHSEPTVTIEIEGFELAGATGEPLDSLTLGRICRVPLPEFGMEFGERIVSLNYPDKLHQPQVVKVTLSNTRTDVMKVIADALKKSGGGSRNAAKQQEEDHAYMIDTKDKVGMVAEAVVGTGEGAWQRISSLIVDGEGIHAKVVRNEQGLVTAYTQIDMNEKRILLEAERASKAEGQLSARIVVEADRITQEVTNRKNSDQELSSRITQTATMIQQEVQNRISSESQLSSRITQTATAIQQEVTNRISSETELGSRITQTATAISQEVSARIAGETSLDSRITQTANAITAEVTRATAAEGTLSGRITTTAEAITAEVTRATTAEGTISGNITVEAGRINQIVQAVGSNNEVTAASICLAINNAGSSATINADKIYLLGQTIANTVDANYITTKLASASAATIKSLTVTNGLTISGNSSLVFSGGDGATITGSVASDLIKNLKIERSGNTYTLQKVTVGDPTWTDVGSFSRAISSWVWGGGSGKVNVTALPQDQTKSINVSIDGPVSISANGTYTYTVDYENSDGDDVSTGATKDITVNVSNAISSWTWGGGSGKINVTALPQNQTKSVNVSIDGRSSITSNGTYTYTVDYEDSSGDDVSTGATKSVSVNVPPRSVSDIRIAGTASAYVSGSSCYKNITISADYDTGGSHTETETLDVTDAYNLGKSVSPSSTGIYDTNSNLVSSQTLNRGSSIDMWGGCYFNGSWIWGSKVTITAQGNPSYNYSMKCTDAVASGSSVIYTFQTTAGSGAFKKDTNYGFWRA